MKKIAVVILALILCAVPAMGEISSQVAGLDALCAEFRLLSTENTPIECTYDRDAQAVCLHLTLNNVSHDNWGTLPEPTVMQFRNIVGSITVILRDTMSRNGWQDIDCVAMLRTSDAVPVYFELNGSDLTWMVVE